MIARARVAAFEILMAVSAARADLPAALAQSRDRLDDDRDRALAAEIATGVERWRALLDHLIEATAVRAIDRLDPEILTILRLSVYQLLFLTRVPAAAVVDDAVELARRVKKRSASGFVNGVLRTPSRKRATLHVPPRPADESDRAAVIDYFAIALSHPRWLVSRWYDRLGFDATERWLQFNNEQARLTLRANRLKATPAELSEQLARDDVRVVPGRFAPDALIVEEGNPLKSHGGHGRDAADGWYVVQDEASQLVSLLTDPAAGMDVLDTCASPGGKTTAMAAAMSNRGRVVACDVRRKRIELLKRTVSASGAPSSGSSRRTPGSRCRSRAVRSRSPDAPCSGLARCAATSDIRWRRHEADLRRSPEAQLRMIRHAADCVVPGGRLVYATCSSEPEEMTMWSGNRFLAAQASRSSMPGPSRGSGRDHRRTRLSPNRAASARARSLLRGRSSSAYVGQPFRAVSRAWKGLRYM